MIIWQLNMQARMLLLPKHEGMVLSRNSFQHFTDSPSDSRGKILFLMCGWETLIPAQTHSDSAACHCTPPLCRKKKKFGEALGGNPASCCLKPHRGTGRIQVIQAPSKEPHSLTGCPSPQDGHSTHRSTVSPTNRVRFSYHLGSS